MSKSTDANVSTEATGGNGVTLTYKHAGEEKVLDITNPEDLRRAQVLLSKGTQYDTVQEEKKALSQQLGNWNEALERARDDEEAWLKVKGMVEGVTGRKFEDVEQVEEHFDNQSAKELKTLKKQLSDMQAKQATQEMRAELNALKAKYGDDFNEEAVIAAAKEYGITNFEILHHYVSKDAAIEKERQKLLNKQKTTQEKREKAFVESGNNAPPPGESQQKHKTYKDVSASVLGDLRQKGESLFTDD